MSPPCNAQAAPLQVSAVVRKIQKNTHVLMVNGAHAPSTTCDPICMWTLGCFIFLTPAFQYSLSAAYMQSSRHELVVGASMRRSPFVGFLYISNTACLICLSCPSLSMCPSHCSRLARIHITTSNVLSAVASSRIVLPVIVLTHHS